MSNFTLTKLSQNETFDPLTVHKETAFTQSPFYGDWQKSMGRKADRFLVKENGNAVAFFQIIKYPLIGNKSYLYIPYGPVCKSLGKDLLAFLKLEIDKINKENNAVFTRLDFTPHADKTILGEYFTKSWLSTYHSSQFQPRTEWLLGLEEKEDIILQEMDKKNRYSIRMSARNNVWNKIIKDNFDDYFDIFYDLMSATAKRDGFSLHNKGYYHNIFSSLGMIQNSFLSISSINEKIQSICLIIVYNATAYYLFGGSDDDARQSAASYSAVWEAIKYSKIIACKNFNFGGISNQNDTNHGLDNLTRFKRRFGGYTVEHSLFFDVVNKPFWYLAYNLRKFLKL